MLISEFEQEPKENMKLALKHEGISAFRKQYKITDDFLLYNPF